MTTSTMTTTSEPRDEHGVNLAFVLLVHFGLGFFWLFAIAGIVGEVFSFFWGIVWGLSAAVTWVLDSSRIVRARYDPGQAWGLTFLWWLKSFIAPIALAFDALRSFAGPEQPAEPPAAATPAPPPPPTPAPAPAPATGAPPGLTARLDDFGRRLARLEEELRELRRLAQTPEPMPEAPAVAPPPVPPPPPPPPPPAARPQPAPAREQPPRRPSYWDRQITFDDLFGAKALAWAGGVVTLLGIVFFFVLAVNRGWIGPVERVSLGALASVLVFGAGLWLRRAYGPVHSALAAAGAGIAGGYATLLAATALYELVPRGAALVLAAGIAAVATATALAWESELLAGLGLVGAMLAPAAIALQDNEFSAVGTAFAALMFAAGATVAVQRRWQPLLGVAFVATIWQIGGLVAEAGVTDWDVVAVAAAFWLPYLGAAVAFQLRVGPSLASLPSTLVLAGALLAGLSAVQLFEGVDEGWALLVVAAVHALAAVAFFPQARNRDLSAFLGAAALGVGAVAAALILDGPALTIAWAAEAAVLSWLARRADELRYQVVALVYLIAAAVHALFWDAPLSQLYDLTGRPTEGVAGVVAVGLAALVFVAYTDEWRSTRAYRGVFAFVAPALDSFRDAQRLWRSIAAWGAVLAGVYAASLGVLEAAQWVAADESRATFEWGHVAVTGLWGLVAVGLILLGHRVPSLELRVGGYAWLATVALQAIFFNTTFEADPRGYAYLVASAVLLVGALVDRLAVAEEPAFPLVAGFHLVGVGLGVAAVFTLLSGDWEGYGLLGVAALHAAIAAAVWRRDRDLATLLWAPALAVAAYAATILLSGSELVLAWAGAAAALALLADRLRDAPLQLGSAVLLVLSLGHTLGFEAPLADLFEANPHPENGVPALLFCIAALAVFGFFARSGPEPLLIRAGSYAAGGLLAIYAGSLAILGLAEAVGDAGVATNFQRGHSGVSAFWGTIGLIALYLGLRRGARWLRVGGFALFGLALAKLFLYDLAFLSSITRALSFLAVGAVLLFGGFLVQRLGADRDSSAPRATTD
jgi:uncharacterized membrane protein